MKNTKTEKYLENQSGFIPVIIGIILFIFLVVGVAVSFVVGLDNMVSKEDPSESIFSDESEIKPMLENIREKKKAVAAKVEEAAARVEEWRENQQTQNNENSTQEEVHSDSKN